MFNLSYKRPLAILAVAGGVTATYDVRGQVHV